MRIIHVSNGNFKRCGQKFYDQARKINNGFTRNGHDVFFISDRDVARSSNIFSSSRWGHSYVNKYLIKCCQNYAPDLIMLGHADLISAETLHEIRKLLPNIKIAQWNVDPIYRPHNIEQIKSKLDVVDATFITTAGPGLKRFNTQHGIVSFFPNIVDKSIEWPECFDRNDQEFDIFWALRAGNTDPKGYDRISIPLFLEQSKKVTIDYYGMNGQPLLFDHRYFEAIYNCKIGLNISNISTYSHLPKATDEELYLYSSDRIAHYMGCGLLVFTTTDNKLEKILKPDEEIIFFSSKEELLEKILYYQEHDDERRRIAKQGWQKAHRDFNETIVTKYMLEAIFSAGKKDISNKAEYAWPTEKY